MQCDRIYSLHKTLVSLYISLSIFYLTKYQTKWSIKLAYEILSYGGEQRCCIQSCSWSNIFILRKKILCFIYVICACLRIVVFNILCCVFVFYVPNGLSILDYPVGILFHLYSTQGHLKTWSQRVTRCLNILCYLLVQKMRRFFEQYWK
jgi:hypothetical protein